MPVDQCSSVVFYCLFFLFTGCNPQNRSVLPGSATCSRVAPIWLVGRGLRTAPSFLVVGRALRLFGNVQGRTKTETLPKWSNRERTKAVLIGFRRNYHLAFSILHSFSSQ